MRRIMGAVLQGERRVSGDIWNEHAEILDAIVAGDGVRAEGLGRAHIVRASAKFSGHVRALQEQADADRRRRSLARRAAG